MDHVVEIVAQFPEGLTKTNPETIDGKKVGCSLYLFYVDNDDGLALGDRLCTIYRF